MKRNIVFVSAGAKEILGSFGYEHLFSVNKKMSWSYSIAIQPFLFNKSFSVPLSINAFTNHPCHHFEVDFTAAFYMDKFHSSTQQRSNDYNKRFYLSPFVCYRFQKSSGIVLKTGIGPRLLLDPPSDNFFHITASWRPLTAFISAGISF